MQKIFPQNPGLGVHVRLLQLPVVARHALSCITGTALHVAARENSIRCVEAILSWRGGETDAHGGGGGVELEALATEHRQTPLMTAALHGHVDMVRLLVAAGADIDRQTSTCSTALIVACHYGHVDCVHALLGQSPTVSALILSPFEYAAFISLVSFHLTPFPPPQTTSRSLETFLQD